jgi:transposase InsO family protein
VNVFPFIEAEKAEQRNVAKACEMLEVSRSAFYEWHQHTPSTRQRSDEELGERIQDVYDESRGTYGWPRVHQALRDDGVCVGRKRVARIMRTKGLVGRCRRRWIKTTISDPDVVAVDRLKRTFGPGNPTTDAGVGAARYRALGGCFSARVATPSSSATARRLRVPQRGGQRTLVGSRPAPGPRFAR